MEVTLRVLPVVDAQHSTQKEDVRELDPESDDDHGHGPEACSVCQAHTLFFPRKVIRPMVPGGGTITRTSSSVKTLILN